MFSCYKLRRLYLSVLISSNQPSLSVQQVTVSNAWKQAKNLRLLSSADRSTWWPSSFARIKFLRSSFINDNEKENPNLTTDFRTAIKMNLFNIGVMTEMQNLVHQHCQPLHVFELIYDNGKLVDCETRIRFFLGQGKAQEYLNYNSSVSQPFLHSIEELLKALTNVGDAINYPEAQVDTMHFDDYASVPASQDSDDQQLSVRFVTSPYHPWELVSLIYERLPVGFFYQIYSNGCSCRLSGTNLSRVVRWLLSNDRSKGIVCILREFFFYLSCHSSCSSPNNAAPPSANLPRFSKMLVFLMLPLLFIWTHLLWMSHSNFILGERWNFWSFVFQWLLLGDSRFLGQRSSELSSLFDQ